MYERAQRRRPVRGAALAAVLALLALLAGVATPARAAATSRPAHAAVGPSALVAQLARELAIAGPGAGAYVYDLSAGRVLFAARSDVARPPASVEKLYTAWTALTRMGTAAQLSTRVLGVGTSDAAGVWHGDLYLRGGGDPTLADGALSALARTLRYGAHITAVEGRILGDASYFDSHRGGPSAGYRYDPDLTGVLSALALDRGAGGHFKGPHAPADYAASRLLAALRRLGVSVSGGSDAGTTPPGAIALAQWSSPSIGQLLGQTLPPSDNFYAEMIEKGLGAAFGAGGTTAAGAAVVRSTVAALGLHPAIVDGSGLSRGDRSSPRQLATLLVDIAPTALGRVLRSDLAVAGRSGTLMKRMRGTAAAGNCQAKTGTLIGVSNLAGYCLAAGGHTLVFALEMDGVGVTTAHRLQDNIAITLARYDDHTPAPAPSGPTGSTGPTGPTGAGGSGGGSGGGGGGSGGSGGASPYP